MTVACQYCNKTVSTARNLLRHQKTKACQRARGDVAPDVIEDRYQCVHCGKYLCDASYLKKHMVNCTARLNDVIEKQKVTIAGQDNVIMEQASEISSLKMQLQTARLEAEVEILRGSDAQSKKVIEEIAKQPRHQTTNNLILPTIDTSQETVNRVVATSYSMNHFCSGQKGVARFAVDHLLVDENDQLGYVCTDPSRGTFKHLSDEGEIVRDVKASRLTTKLAQPIKAKAGQLAGQLVEMDRGNKELFNEATRRLQDVSELGEDNSAFRLELAGITTL